MIFANKMHLMLLVFLFFIFGVFLREDLTDL